MAMMAVFAGCAGEQQAVSPQPGVSAAADQFNLAELDGLWTRDPDTVEAMRRNNQGTHSVTISDGGRRATFGRFNQADATVPLERRTSGGTFLYAGSVIAANGLTRWTADCTLDQTATPVREMTCTLRLGGRGGFNAVFMRQT